MLHNYTVFAYFCFNLAKASPVQIPARPCPPTHGRPMRNSVEGLNQEIEKLVLHPGQQHTCRPESNLFSRGTPEGHRAPLADILHGETRSVNTQTPNRDLLSSGNFPYHFFLAKKHWQINYLLFSDDSQSTSPEDGVATGASPRINRFLAREPPDGCEKVSFLFDFILFLCNKKMYFLNIKFANTNTKKNYNTNKKVCLKLNEADQSSATVFKPCVGFLLKPSLTSAFQPLQPTFVTPSSTSDITSDSVVVAADTIGNN